MRKSPYGLILLLILLTTYNPKLDFIINSNLNIQKIIVENNLILDSNKIKEKLNFLYKENLFFFKTKNIVENLKNETFIKSFSIKKIYPNTLKLIIVERKPIAILQNKKKKFYISDQGSLINFIEIKAYSNLPIVFGDGRNFYSLYKDIQSTRFKKLQEDMLK